MPQPQQDPLLYIHARGWIHSQQRTTTVRKIVAGRSVLNVPGYNEQRAQAPQQRQPVTWLDPEGSQHVLVEKAELVTALRVTLDQPDVRTFALHVQRGAQLLDFVLNHDRIPDLEVANDNA